VLKQLKINRFPRWFTKSFRLYALSWPGDPQCFTSFNLAQALKQADLIGALNSDDRFSISELHRVYLLRPSEASQWVSPPPLLLVLLHQNCLLQFHSHWNKITEGLHNCHRTESGYRSLNMPIENHFHFAKVLWLVSRIAMSRSEQNQ